MVLRFILERLVRSVLTIWLVVTLVFFGIHVSGDPAQMMLGDAATPADILVQDGNHLSAYAADDAHAVGARPGVSDAFGNWVYVKANSLDPDLLPAALKAGEFYASTSAQLRNIAIEGDELVVASSPATVILVTGKGGYKYKLAGSGEPLEAARFPLTPIQEMGYCRVTVIGQNGERA